MIQVSILETAYLYEGYQELEGNSGFKNDIFQQKMEAVGWDKGQAWCSYFAELVWKEAYGKIDSSIISELDKLFSANAVQTFENFKNAGWETGKIPFAGDIAIWAYYKNGKPKKNGIWTLGHAGIVLFKINFGFKAIEGNTNSEGGREGIEVAEKQRSLDFKNKNGLRLLGFVKPKEI